MKKSIIFLFIVLFFSYGTSTGESSNNSDKIINIKDPYYANYQLMWEKNLGADILDVDISKNGKIISAVAGILKSASDVTLIQIMNDAGESLWSTDNPSVDEMSLSPEGNCLVMPGGNSIYIYPDLMPTTKAGRIGSWRLDTSSNCDTISVSAPPKIILWNRKGEQLWNYQVDNTELLKSIAMTNNGDYILASNPDKLLLLDNKGKLVWEKKLSDLVSSSISPEGKYIAAASVVGSHDPVQTIFIYNNRGTLLRSYRIETQTFLNIRRIIVSDSGIIAIYVTALNKELKSTIFLINATGNLVWKKEFDHQITSFAISNYGSHMVIGTENGDIYYFVRPDIEKSVEILYETEIDNPVNPMLIFVGIIGVGVISSIFAYPYYKRSKLKKQMAKTPTDWCPHCKKFTGGAKVCPHCGKDTLVKTKYDASKKQKKK